MSVTELHEHVSRKFGVAGYEVKPVLIGMDTRTETVTYLLHYHTSRGVYLPKWDTTVYAQCVVDDWGTRGAATFSHKPTERSAYQVPITTD